MIAQQCSFCERLRALNARRIPVHLHAAALEGFVVTRFWSDGSRTQYVAATGAHIQGPVF